MPAWWQLEKKKAFIFAFEKIERTPNTLDARRLIELADSQGIQDAVVETLFLAYFTEGQDIGNQQVLLNVADKAGLDRGLAEKVPDRAGELAALQTWDDGPSYVDVLVQDEFPKEQAAFAIPHILEFQISSTRFWRCVLQCESFPEIVEFELHASPVQGVDGTCLLEVTSSLDKFKQLLVYDSVPEGGNTGQHKLPVKARIDFVDRRTNHGLQKTFRNWCLRENACNQPFSLVIVEGIFNPVPITRCGLGQVSPCLPDDLLNGLSIMPLPGRPV